MSLPNGRFIHVRNNLSGYQLGLPAKIIRDESRIRS